MSEKPTRVRSINEGANCFTDFFHVKPEANGDPTEPFTNFMNDHDVDFHTGKVSRRKNNG